MSGEQSKAVGVHEPIDGGARARLSRHVHRSPPLLTPLLTARARALLHVPVRVALRVARQPLKL